MNKTASPARFVGRSRLAAELRRLPKHAKSALQVDHALVVLVDVVVTACVLIVDDQDARPWEQRLSDLDALLDGGDDLVVLTQTLKHIERLLDPRTGELPTWIRRITDQGGGNRYLLRLLGADLHYRLLQALKVDAAPVVVAVRRLLRWFLPFTVALDDCSSLLTPQQVGDIYRACGSKGKREAESVTSLLETMLLIDGKLDRAADLGVPLQDSTARPEEHQHLEVGDVRDFARDLRGIVSGQTHDLVVHVSEVLANKVQGARDALHYSADPVSQAANSLIELIDRLLRQAFQPDVALAWVRANRPHDSSLTYTANSGEERITKLGQALCFAYAGRVVKERSPFNEIAAAGLIAARSQLQKLKHSDVGSEDEKQQMLGLLAAVEAYLVLTIRVTWVLGPDEDLERLRSRFAAAA